MAKRRLTAKQALGILQNILCDCFDDERGSATEIEAILNAAVNSIPIDESESIRFQRW